MASQPVTLDKAQQAVSAAAQKLNHKIVSGVSKFMEQAALDHQLYIFNVSPIPLSRNLGDLGTYTVPARVEGGEISEALVIPGVVRNSVPVDMNKNETRYEDEGITVAQDIILTGRGFDPSSSREHWGCFISHTPTPNKVQVAEAKRKWYAQCQKLVDMADTLERQNKREEISNQPILFIAAAELKLTRPWCNPSQAMDVCPACNASINPGVAVCGTCKAIVDEAKARKFFPERFVASK